MSGSLRQGRSQYLRRRTYRSFRRRRIRRNTGVAGTLCVLAVAAATVGSSGLPGVMSRATTAGRKSSRSAVTSRTAGEPASRQVAKPRPTARSETASRVAIRAGLAKPQPVPPRPAARPVTKHKAESPTPVFAFSHGLILCLPYPKSRVTAIAYHQVYAPDSFKLVPAPQVTHVRMDDDTPAGLVRARTLNSRGKTVPQRRMFRSDRRGPANRAVDVGTRRGTPVRAPVSGKIIAVRPYMLYGKYPDVEIDILPDANPAVRVTLFHVARVRVKRGQRVSSGVTVLGKVRDIARYFEPQLAEYTHERGNHIHIQVKPLKTR